MGIYDREYYRGEKSGPAWFSGPAPWCKTLILINVVVFLAQRAFHVNDQFVISWLAATPEGIFHHGRIWELLTATFLHDQQNFWHIIVNMVFLWIVGREMESLYGGRDFLAFYLAAAIVSTFCWAVVQEFSPAPAYMVGASGAVLAVVTLYTLYYPRREILFFGFIPMPMWLVLGIYLVWPMLADGRHGSGVAYQSHLAGAAFAFLFKYFDLRWSRLTAQFGRPRLKVVSPPRYESSRPRTPVPTRTAGETIGSMAPSAAVLPEDQLDAKLDEVLAKIAREGGTGLTDDERKVLQEASRRARDRRSDRR